MLKKLVLSCAAAMILGGGLSASVFASDVNAVPPIHWSSHPFDNTSGSFKSGKSFCAKKFIGKKTCIPAMNNTADTLTFNTDVYKSDQAPAGNVVTLMGKGALVSTIFTVMDGSTTVYSGPADNRAGIICSTDKVSKSTTCAAWK